MMHRVTSTDGTCIAVWETGSGPALLLVHGATAHHTRWSRVTPILEQHCRVFAMDRRGRGESGDAPVYALMREAEDVAAVAEWIGGGVTVLGHSYGAICVLEAALLTSSIARLILYEPPIPADPDSPPHALHAKLAELIAQRRREDALVAFFREVVGTPLEELEMLRAHPAWPARVAAAHTLPRELAVQSTYRLEPTCFARLETPTTLLLGAESPPDAKEATRRVHELLPRSEIVELVGQQHIAMDIIPEAFGRLVIAAVRT